MPKTWIFIGDNYKLGMTVVSGIAQEERMFKENDVIP